MAPIMITLHPGWLIFLGCGMLVYVLVDGWRAKIWERLNEYADEDRSLVRSVAECLQNAPDIETGRAWMICKGRKNENAGGINVDHDA